MHPDQETLKSMMQAAGLERGRILQPRRRRGRAAPRLPHVSPRFPIAGGARAEPRAALDARWRWSACAGTRAAPSPSRSASSTSRSPSRPPGEVTAALPRRARDLTVRISPFLLPRLAAREEAALREVEMQGDAELAQEVAFLARHLSWDVEEDLSQVIGDIAAHRLVAWRAGRASLGARRHRRGLPPVPAEYWTEESPFIASRVKVEEFVREVAELRDAVERLDKRVGARRSAGAGSEARLSARGRLAPELTATCRGPVHVRPLAILFLALAVSLPARAQQPEPPDEPESESPAADAADGRRGGAPALGPVSVEWRAPAPLKELVPAVPSRSRHQARSAPRGQPAAVDARGAQARARDRRLRGLFLDQAADRVRGRQPRARGGHRRRGAAQHGARSGDRVPRRPRPRG